LIFVQHAERSSFQLRFATLTYKKKRVEDKKRPPKEFLIWWRGDYVRITRGGGAVGGKMKILLKKRILHLPKQQAPDRRSHLEGRSCLQIALIVVLHIHFMLVQLKHQAIPEIHAGANERSYANIVVMDHCLEKCKGGSEWDHYAAAPE
jgi:hypothetical protein